MAATEDREELQEPAPPDPDPLAPPPREPPARVEPVVVPRWLQLVLVPLAALGLWQAMQAAGRVLLLFIIAALIALLLNPFVSLLRRIGFPRGLAVLTVFAGLISLLAGLGVLLADPIADQVSALQDNVPDYVDEANAGLADLDNWLQDRGIEAHIADQGRTALQTLGDSLTEGSGDIVGFTREALTLAVEGSLAVILTIVVCVYMLLYGERIGAGVRTIVPRGDGTKEDDFPSRIQHAVFGYVRGQLLFSTIMGASAGVMLWILGSLGVFPEGKTYALFFGLFYGFAELIPYIGPAIGAFPPVMIALFGPEPLDALWLVVAFTALQQIEGHIVAPNVFAQALRINPLLVIFALLFGGQIYGFVGAFIALPIAAMLRETVVYFRRHLVLEPWPRVAVAMASTGIDDRGPPAACPECGTAVASGTPTCPACGTELDEPGARAAATAAAPG